MGGVVAVLNQKGGVGKTTVTLGLASAAAAAGHRVLVVDLDPQASSTWVLGLDPSRVDVSTADVLGRTAAGKAMVPSAWGGEVWVIPASPRLLAREHGGNPTRLRDALVEVSDQFHAVLIDCPPSLGALSASALSAASHAVIVVEPSALGLRGIGAVADLVDDVWDTHNPDLELAGVIVNKVPAVSTEADRRYEELARIVGKKAIWQPVVPHRVIVNQAIGERRPIHTYGARSGEVSEVFDKLWAKLRRITRP
ncbi:MAG: ParA family protein [Actinobacteria bacterium]|jgi:chromosome partitioning protein|nr:ParA family protein [Acidimicrobiaceae bacterium]MBP6488487.1 ParA family protein [Ilumatobacteraceae bacterium]NMD25981.1 ParA family protein [Actinomycetota bacterium]MBP7891025.1 ParA family protein [Ilumatobacteraceae bacterium]HQY14817.1 ParA family protein [Ilumatobacteraceae bacterium]